tara:strand:+ start:82957 stop:83406 length:450 start_codon:yes stop_codon:yes gene_type:complete
LAKILIIKSFEKGVDPFMRLAQSHVMMWLEIKDWLELSTGLDRDSLHIYAGIGVQLTVALCIRRSLASSIPWLFVALAACGNEYYDYMFVSDAAYASGIYADEAVRDIWNTLLLPTLFLLIARRWPNWLTRKPAALDKAETLEGAGLPL